MGDFRNGIFLTQETLKTGDSQNWELLTLKFVPENQELYRHNPFPFMTAKLRHA